MDAPPPPNIVFILSDDQGPWAMNCAGTSELHTPNLDRIAADGVRFTHFHCVSPVCSPARASILTGRIPSKHGVHDWLRAGDTSDIQLEPDGNGALIEYLAGQPAYTDVLAANGYVCGLSGKWHLGDSHHPQKSHTFWEVHAKGGSPYYNAPMIRDGEVHHEPGYVTEVITDHALTFLEKYGRGPAPFYLGIHHIAPHSPWGRDQHPHETWDRHYNESTFSANPDLPPHPWAKMLPWPTTPEKRREKLAGYYTAVEEMDKQIGRILDWLDENDQRENTLVVFTSDNGMSMGHHGLYGKGNASYPLNMYDEAVKVPTLIRHPGRISPGQVVDHLLSHYDIMPTLLDYVGVANPHADELPGRSFAPLLRGDALPDQRDVVVFDEYGPTRMIRTRDWKYVHRYLEGPNELYDMVNDPGETHNLADDPAQQERIVAMQERMQDWFTQHADPTMDGKTLPVIGQGQLGRVDSGETPEVLFSK